MTLPGTFRTDRGHPPAPPRALACLLAALLLAATLSGCSGSFRWPWQKQSMGYPPQSSEEEAQTGWIEDYARALNFYEAEEYEEAGALFRQLTESAESDAVLARIARYGHGCSLLASARSRADLENAVAIFDTWSEQAPRPYPPEDPRLLLQLLPMFTPALPKETSRAVRKWKAESARLERELAEAREREAAIAEENANLLKQIEALKRLDQEIQMKKKELSRD